LGVRGKTDDDLDKTDRPAYASDRERSSRTKQRSTWGDAAGKEG